jgi:hypothetical protein
MFAYSFGFEFFFFVLFALVSLAFSTVTTLTPDKFGRVLGFFVTLGFLKLTWDAGMRTGYALLN